MKDKRRIIEIVYSPDELPKCQTNEELTAFQAAVGRMVLYGMTDVNDSVNESQIEMVIGSFRDKGTEFDCVYFRPIPANQNPVIDGHQTSFGSSESILVDLLNTLRNRALALGRSFVMGAVKHNDGKWGFHS